MNVSDERAGSLFMVELSILQPWRQRQQFSLER